MIVVAITIHGGCDAHAVTCLGIYVHTTTVGVGNPVKSLSSLLCTGCKLIPASKLAYCAKSLVNH